MTILKSKTKQALPDDAFAIPSERKYPIHDLSHARNALARVSEFGTPEEKVKVHHAVYSRWAKYLHEESKTAIKKHMDEKNTSMMVPEDKPGKAVHDTHKNNVMTPKHDKGAAGGICPTCGSSVSEHQVEEEGE